LRSRSQLGVGHLANVRYFTFNHKFGHRFPLTRSFRQE